MFDITLGGALLTGVLALGGASGSTLLRTLPVAHVSVGAAQAGAPQREAMVVSTDWLARNLADPDLVLLHVGSAEGFQSGHIPGARLISGMDLAAPRVEGALSLEMPAPEDLRRRLEALGVSDRSRIVVYYGQDWVSPATRVLFTLSEAGLGPQTSLLDGGLRAWTGEGRATTADAPPPPTPGRLTRPFPASRVVDVAFVQAHVGQPGYVLIDARNPEFYTGATPGGTREKPRNGHIPGAVSLPFTHLADDDLRVTPADQLAELFSRAGVKPGDTVIAYCHIGQQATAILFAAQSLGFNVLLYDGAMDDWARRDLPVEASTGG